MTNSTCRIIALITVLALLAGCNSPPTPRKYLVVPITSVTVNYNNAEEFAVVSDYIKARTDYNQALVFLYRHYEAHHDLAGQRWVGREYKNLADAQVFKYLGVEPANPSNEALASDVRESMLVERVVATRGAYLTAAQLVAEHYAQRGPKDNARAADSVVKRFDPIHTYLYLAEAEFPSWDLRSMEPIVPASDLFQRALTLHEKGKGFMKAFFFLTDYDKQRDALSLFRQVITDYPTSDRIALAAYYTGEIYKEYFREDLRAVRWYELAFTWDPNIMLPARFQAATVYDLRLNNKARALELYERVLVTEHFNQSNVSFAARRINEIRDEAALFRAQVGAEPRPTPVEPPLN